ncbi:histidine N-alpha-methyltransferase [Psychrosphaera saromensis]|uniref:Dimethylhistidine N-methyltransferase n=1 Tax=Psychrosphaera saromensis TaxID=716813 RepID=A0A2S7UTB0_9GAMM|nr:L-histidine N(alpha)-methyltransferase [Psychrosphaera saromensis]PQJ52975.1 dimethylhistidine N-methyltransferase [Psychrosphaera saromensis]GHB77473.1 histidine N-alpha-methyltransferase [Psychrosphaera saromensis]GLQ12865.1 histidine N-alpha-methyltransferase [Psychrosphaera saromensis]
MIEQFAENVDLGLSKSEKTLPSKYFYDKNGDELFIEIMNMPEYYLTRCEMEIFTTQTDELVDSFRADKNEYFELIELGAGDGSKTRKLLAALSDKGYQFDYLPVDISQNSLEQLQLSLQHHLPLVSVVPKHGDYFEMLGSVKDSHHPKIVLFLGSNIGNMTDTVASDFLYQLGANLSKNDKLLLGTDLIKSEDIVLPAYNDESGITHSFNINLLHRMNTELGANFDLDAFSHAPEYNEDEGIAKSYLLSNKEQSVKIAATGKTYHFRAGEKIHTEISRKYDDDVLAKILAKTDFSVNSKFTDQKNYFANYLLNRN